MPRNRKPRGRAPSTAHAKATMPEGDEGRQLEAELREKKIDTMLTDYDLEVKNRIADMKKDITLYMRKLQVLYSVEILKIPKHVRETKISDFLARGGVIDDVAAEEVEDEIHSLAIDARIDKAQAKGKKAHHQADQENAPTSKAARVKPPTGRAAGGGGGRTVRKTRQALLETPANTLTAKHAWAETPLVTPKFDPRLPITPAIGRTARPGEVTMSVHGSPIHRMDEPNHPEFLVPLGRNKTMLITADTELADLEVPEMSASTLQHIQAIQQKLSRLIQAHPAKH